MTTQALQKKQQHPAEPLATQTPAAYQATLFANNAVPKGLACKSYQQTAKKDTDTLILENLELVQRIASKMGTWVDASLSKDDLISAGTIGLVKAAKDYDPNNEADFSTYAYIRIKGAMIDLLRKWSFTPTDTNKQLKELNEAYQNHLNKTGMPPSDTQLAQEMGVPLKKLYKLYDNSRSQYFLSIDKQDSDGYSIYDSFESDSQRPSASMEKQELKEQLANAITSLPEKEKQVIILYYTKQLTMREIAEVLNLTESRVSQLHAKAIYKMKQDMKIEKMLA